MLDGAFPQTSKQYELVRRFENFGYKTVRQIKKNNNKNYHPFTNASTKGIAISPYIVEELLKTT